MSQRSDLPPFVDRLPVAPAARRKLAELGVETPLELLGMIHAARPDFERWLGEDLLESVVVALDAQITPQERAFLHGAPPDVRTGARLEPPPQSDEE